MNFSSVLPIFVLVNMKNTGEVFMNGKKHFYHKGNFSYSAKVKTPLETILEIKNNNFTSKQKLWLEYLNKSEYYLQEYNTKSPSQEIYNILAMFTKQSEDTIVKILSESMDITDFRPWNGDDIPLERYSEEVSNIIQKKQKQINVEMFYRKEYADVLVQTYRNSLLRTYEDQLNLYNLIILLRGDNRVIYSQYNSILFNYLNHIEKDVWFLDENPVYNIKYICNKKKSHVDFKNVSQVKSMKEVIQWQVL